MNPNCERFLQLVDEKTVVLTDRHRQQLHYEHVLDNRQNKHATVWQAPKLYTMHNWVVQEVIRAGYIVLSDMAETHLWLQVLEDTFPQLCDRLQQTAKMQLVSVAQESAMTCSQWCIATDNSLFSYDGNCSFFAKWYSAVQQRCRQSDCITSAQCWQKIQYIKPRAQKYVFAGFLNTTPTINNVIAALRNHAQVHIFQQQPCHTPIKYHAFANDDNELEYISQLAAKYMNRNQATLGIVLPMVTTHWLEAFSAFSRALYPDTCVGESFANANRLFNLSGGIPLGKMPLIDTASRLMKLRHNSSIKELMPLLSQTTIELGVPQAEVGNLEYLNKKTNGDMQLHQLSKKFPHWEWLQKITAQEPSGTDYPSRIVKHLYKKLDSSRWLATTQLSGVEYQQLSSWQDILRDLMQLDCLETKLTEQQCIDLLDNSLKNTFFQPKITKPRIHILDIKEASGLWFDALWVTGLNYETLPAPSSVNMFIPAQLRRKKAIPGNNDADFESQKQLWLSLQAISAHARYSFSTYAQKQETCLSPFLEGLKCKHINWSPSDQETQPETSLDSEPLPLVTQKNWSVQMLEDQSACPFRSAVRHKLAVEEQQDISRYVDSRDIGLLIHKVLEHAHNQHNQHNSYVQEIAQIMQEQAKKSPDSHLTSWLHDSRASRQLQEHIGQLIADWIQLEKLHYTDRTIVEKENTYQVQIEGLSFQFRIDRIDRVGDGVVLIDYKTGHVNIQQEIESERPEKPQLLAYSLALQDKPLLALGYAVLRPGEYGLTLLGDAVPSLSNSNTIVTKYIEITKLPWQQWLEEKRNAVKNLVNEFIHHEVTITPQKKACKYCAYKPICRINAMS